METEEQMNEGKSGEKSDGENQELMKKGENDKKRKTDGGDPKELVRLSKLVNALESIVEAANAALEQIKCIDQVAEEEPKVESSSTDAATILSIKASLGDTSTSCVSYLKNKEGLLRAEWIRIVTELRRELENVDASVFDATRKEEETYMSDKNILREKELESLTTGMMMDTKKELQNDHATKDKKIKDLEEEVQNLKDDYATKESGFIEYKKKMELLKDNILYDSKEMKKKNQLLENERNELAADLKKQKKDMVEQLGDKDKIIQKDKEERNKLADELKKQEEDMREQLDAKEKIINKNEEERKKLAADLQKQELSKLQAKDTTIKEVREKLSKLGEALKKQEENLREQLAAQDEIIKKHEETLPKTLIQNSPLQKVYNSLPQCMQPCLAPKGSVTGDELGT